MLRTLSLVGLLLMLSVSAFAQVAAVPQLMQFQGRLTRPDGTPVPNGNHSIRFSLWTALTGGTEKWDQTINPVSIRNGVFAVLLNTSTGAADMFHGSLWLEIQVGTDPPLTPRQQLASVAYALKADSIKDDGITSSSILDGSITGADIANSTITADDLASNALNPLAWLLGGNSGVTSGFLGTTDNSPLELRVNSRRVMRYSVAENQFYRSINVLGGADINESGAGVIGATIAGGGRDYITGTDLPNRVTADFGTVGGGVGNTASGSYGTIGGGYANIASGFVYATVSGGFQNIANAERATVGGGGDNNASGINSTIGGGRENTTNGLYATVPGGHDNSAVGAYSLAAGRRAKANHNGAFVWADSNNADFLSSAINQFNVRASGGVRIFTNSSATVGVSLSAGDSSWNVLSDRDAKTNFQPVDALEVLEKLVALPLSTWNYKSNTAIRHIGVMAQDFHNAFQLGMDDRHISTVDADGIAFAAIQGLSRKLDMKEKRLAALEAENAELKARLEALAAAVAELRSERRLLHP